MPSLANVKIEKMLAGLLDLSPDMIPVIGPVEKPKGLIIAAGFSGHGFALGPITGKLVSELILDGKPSISLDAFSHSRFVKGKVRMPERLI